MRYIDADELMREVEKAENSLEYHGQEFSYSFLSSGQEISTEWYFVEELINNAPTVDVRENKEGHWIRIYKGNYKCSNCGDWWGWDEDGENEMIEDFKYCPNCGSRMRGIKDE